MTLNFFTATGLTTSADRRRRPIVDRAQVVRTLLLFLSFAVAIGVTSRSSHAAAGDEPRRGFRPFVETVLPRTRERACDRAVFDSVVVGVLPNRDTIAKSRVQAAFVEPICEHPADAVSAGRIAAGRTDRRRERRVCLQRVGNYAIYR